MLKSNLCFPYPVLRSTSIDFKEGIIQSNITKSIIDNKYVFEIKISTNNPRVNEMLNVGDAIRAVYIESGALKYRKMFNVNNNNIVEIECNEIYGKVEIQPCIISKNYISNYYSADFNDDFKGLIININKGDLLGIGDVYEFDALLEKDILKNVASIFVIDQSNDEFMNFDYVGDQVVINLPKEMKENYANLRELKKLYPLLNSVIVFPVLVKLVELYFDDDESLNEYKWYLTISKKIQELIDNKVINQNETDAYKIAQLLVPELQQKAIDEIGNIVEGV